MGVEVTKTNKIAAIVVTYNRCDLLLEAIEALMKSSVECDILIIDNASTDNTKERVERFIDNKKIFYFNTGDNLGGAGGFNLGIKKAYEMGYDYLWTMDDDTIVHEDTLQELIKAKDKLNDDFGFLSSLALWVDGTECVMNYHLIENTWNEKNLTTDGIVKISAATFVSCFIKRDVVKKVGLPIKEYFIWGDDTEYTQRISKFFPSFFVSRSIVTHKMKDNKGTQNVYEITDKARVERLFYSFRNDCCTYKRTSFKKMCYLFYQVLINVAKVMIYSNPYKFLKIKVMVCGFINGLLFFNPPIEAIDN